MKTKIKTWGKYTRVFIYITLNGNTNVDKCKEEVVV